MNSACVFTIAATYTNGNSIAISNGSISSLLVS